MLYIIPQNVIKGIFGGLWFLVLFAGFVAMSAKTGFIDGSPYNLRNFSKVRIYNDKTQLRRYFHFLLITFNSTTTLGFMLYGFDLPYIILAAFWGAIITLTSAYGFWYLVVVKVKDNDEDGPP